MIISSDYVRNFCKDYDYPEEATDALLSAYNKLAAAPSASLFDQWVSAYNRDVLDFGSLSFPIERPDCPVHPYTQSFLFFIFLSPHLFELYARKGLPEKVCRDTLEDLKWKLLECHKLHGIWGTFVPQWFVGHFEMIRFALGRFQFEFSRFHHRFESSEFKVENGSPALVIHIPSSGEMSRETRLASYAKAYDFFGQYFPEYLPDGRLLFTCDSWLLYPPMREWLHGTGNIVSFMDDFNIIASRQDPTHHNFWRIFYKMPFEDDEQIPQNTTLQKEYLKRVREGIPGGCGIGLFCMKNHQILKGKDGSYYE